MTLSIDHIVIHVQDLQGAIDNYRQAGFTVNYGGQHADGITENGLIIFADGTYIELIALVAGRTYDEAGFKGLLNPSGEGYTGYALKSDSLEADIEAMRGRGVHVGNIREGSRARPDGERLQWKMAMINDAMQPFVIQDMTDRNLRVPLTAEHTTHPNTATGIHELLIRARNIDETANFFGNTLGTPLTFYGSARFELGTTAIVISGSADGSLIPVQLALYSDETEPKQMTLNGADILLI